MTAWWTGLSARERTLIVLAAGLVGALVIFQFGLAPLAERRESARRAYVEALDVLAEVRAGVADAAAAAPQDAAAGGNLRAALLQSAQRRGLSINRIQPLDDGGLSLRFESADPETLYAWLAAASEENGVRVRQATLRRNERRGVIQATLVVEGGGR